MSGNELKDKILSKGLELKNVAALMGITPQDLYSKLNSADIKVSFLEKMAEAINTSVFELWVPKRSSGNSSESSNDNAQTSSVKDLGIEYDPSSGKATTGSAFQVALEAAQAATAAANSATTAANLAMFLMQKHEQRIADAESRLGALHHWIETELQPLLKKTPGQIDGELNIAFRRIQEEKRTGIPAGADT